MNIKKYIKRLLLLIISIIICITFVFTPLKKIPHSIKSYSQPTWVNVFIHGSFGTSIGLLSTFKILQDDVANSKYHQITRLMRNDPFFYQLQIILNKGLVKVEPSFDLQTTNGNKFAAYPIIKSFDIVSRFIRNNKKQLYYTYGWSGLLSQKSRRIESIKFYNKLSTEIEKLKQSGINPKIRIIAHSHGGNLVANIAAITLRQAQGDRELKTTKQMQNLISSLPSKKNAKKKWYYKPTSAISKIDELILFGTPIQPETDYLFSSATFKKVYNFYSEADVIQTLDGLSTKRFFSEQRIEINKKLKKASHIIQARITLGEIKALQNTQATQEEEASWWKKLFVNFSKNVNAPTHKELWFFDWRDETSQQSLFMKPLPTVVLTPILIKLIEQTKNATDVDINIQANSKKLTAFLMDHDKQTIRNKKEISTEIITNLKKQVSKWKPENFTQSTELKVINKHCRNFL